MGWSPPRSRNSRVVAGPRPRLCDLLEQGEAANACVTPATIDFYGAVSTECAEEMAKGALAHASVDLAISVTGIAGPTGALVGKPIGLVYFCAASRSGRVIAHDRKYGDIGRSNVRCASVLQAFSMLQELAEKEEPRPPAGKKG